MKKIALIYWPKKGNTESCAFKIAQRFESDTVDVFTIKNITAAEFSHYDAFIIGAPTTGADNWEEAHKSLWHKFFEKLAAGNVKGKPFAIFGLGDQILYPNNFVDGIVDIKNEFEKLGAVACGIWPTTGYEYSDSASVEDEAFLGLALDEDQQAELTDERIDSWVTQIWKEFGF